MSYAQNAYDVNWGIFMMPKINILIDKSKWSLEGKELGKSRDVHSIRHLKNGMYGSTVGTYMQKRWDFAFDENGMQITRRVIYSEKWYNVPIFDLIAKVGKRSLNVDLDIKYSTTGDEALLVEYERTITAISRFNFGKPYETTSEIIGISSWEKTGKTRWRRTYQSLSTGISGFRICPGTCGAMP